MKKFSLRAGISKTVQKGRDKSSKNVKQIHDDETINPTFSDDINKDKISNNYGQQYN